MTSILDNLPTVYNAKITEEEIYKFWEENEFFKADAKSKKPPYSIVIPPPNVTGVLHMGHALDGTLQDILTRYHRMSGYEALWLPGTDHAGIATQNVVEKNLREKGANRHKLGREKFLKITWDWANEHRSAILNQFKRLGASFDLSRERFTLDKGCSNAVKEVFIKLYEKGLIYKGAYIVNWCPRCQSAISDIETEYETENGHLWEISYPFKDGPGAIVIATTRPETMFGDVAIAVNPTDFKYKDLIGRTVCMPLTGKSIPIIADEYVDKHFGTGALKITPAHDPNDYEVGKRHNLKPVWVIDEEGKMRSCPEVPWELHGIDRVEARKKTIEMLEIQQALVKITEHVHNVGKCQRCNTTIEPLLSEQWFVKMEPLAKEGIAAIKDGRIKFVPERWEKNYLGWMENIRDWCISRQLWWGHQIPAYYHNITGEMIVSRENPDPKNYTQDPDVLDTWFSSGLWPFSTMGFPNTESEDFKKFYPTSVLVTGFDIIFFWVARMIVMGLEFTSKAPFSTVYIHGLIRDDKGQKMSKSKGNTIDPVEIIDKYGCDALRFTLTSLCTYGGQDIKVSDERFEYGRNFANKIWNASRFVLMNLEGIDDKEIDFDNLTIADKWILDKLNNTAKEVNDNIKNYRIGEIAHILYDFFWNYYCDWYVEIAKIQLSEENLKLNTQRVLKYVLDMSLRLLHPIMPHITERIYSLIPNHKFKAIMLADFPVYQEKLKFVAEAKQMEELVIEAITGLRNKRALYNVPVSNFMNINLWTTNDEKNVFENNTIQLIIRRLARVNKITFDKKQSLNRVVILVGKTKISVFNEDIFNRDVITSNYEAQLKKLQEEKHTIEVRLNNEKFVKNAPKEVVDKAVQQLEELKSTETAIKNELSIWK